MQLEDAELTIRIVFGPSADPDEGTSELVFSGAWTNGTVEDLASDLRSLVSVQGGNDYIPFALTVTYDESQWGASGFGAAILMVVAESAVGHIVDRFVDAASDHLKPSEHLDFEVAKDRSRTRVATKYKVAAADLRLTFEGETQDGWQFEWSSDTDTFYVDVRHRGSTYLARRPRAVRQ